MQIKLIFRLSYKSIIIKELKIDIKQWIKLSKSFEELIAILKSVNKMVVHGVF